MIKKAYERLIRSSGRRLKYRLLFLLRDPDNIPTVSLSAAAITSSLLSVLYSKFFTGAEKLFIYLSDQLGLWMMLGSIVCFVAGSALIKHFAFEAGGSGIPQILAASKVSYNAENKIKIDRILSLKTALIKVLSSILIVMGGGAVGREGPTLHISSCIFHFFANWIRKFSIQISEQTWVISGSAAGLAAAFNTPLGGIVYAIEELGIVHFNKIRTALIAAVILSGLFAQWLLGPYLMFGYPKVGKIGLFLIPYAVLLGLVSGLSGAIFGRVLYRIVRFRVSKLKGHGWLIISISAAILMFIFSRFNSHSSGSGVALINQYLFQEGVSNHTDLLFRFLGPLVTYAAGAAGGIFAPSLSVGASLGAMLGDMLLVDYRNLFTLLGMVGFLTGVTRTPFTAFILVLEMTDRHTAIFPMMVCALFSYWIAQLVDNRSFYDRVSFIYQKLK